MKSAFLLVMCPTQKNTLKGCNYFAKANYANYNTHSKAWFQYFFKGPQNVTHHMPTNGFGLHMMLKVSVN